LAFTAQGELHHAHLERGVTLHSEEVTEGQNGQAKGGQSESLRVRRDWRSPVADIDFRNAGRGQPELAGMHGTGGVVVTGESQLGTGPVAPSRMAADEIMGEFGAHQALTSMTGTGHASMEQTSAAGTRQQTCGDRIEAHFLSGPAGGAKAPLKAGRSNAGRPDVAAQIESATVDGNVVLVREPAAKPGEQAPAALRATAGKAVYEGADEWLHLTVSPRVEDGGLQLTADKVDVSEASGDAFAHGNVKATWLDTGASRASRQARPGVKSADGAAVPGSVALGGQGPAHVIAAEAQLHQATGEATFTGKARLWQQENSVAAPVIVLDRSRRTLVARSTNAAEPVKVVFLSAAGMGDRVAAGKGSGAKDSGNRAPSVIRVRGADLKYSDAERKALMHGGSGGSVVAENGTATTVSNDVELVLLPPGNHAGNDGAAGQVDRMTASGHVAVSSQGRKGTGERLAYSSETDQYVLTGTAAVPPKMTDPARGVVTGESLIFNSRDDSVSVEGGGRKTTTETRAPQ
jgi:lipopolysaccharide export system protein LptA